MKPFLKKLAENIYDEHNNELDKICIIFPNRRAGLFFKKYLSESAGKTIWSPDIYSFEDFLKKHVSVNIPDDITLIFKLFDIYKKYEGHETIERFFSWGKILLEDFNEIEKNLVDAHSLFNLINEQKLIEEQFDYLDPEDREDLLKFLESFTGKNSFHKKRFTEIWEVISKVYDDFNGYLLKNNLAYAGMLYRRVYEKITAGEIDFKYAKIIMAGFSTLSKSEEMIIKHLYKENKAEVYFDSDEYYLNDVKQEAGMHIRKLMKELDVKNPFWKENILKSEQKTVNIFPVSLIAGQVKGLGAELKKLSQYKNFQPEKTAVVIPEESLLIPLLNSLPESIEDVNVTLGISLRNTSLFTLMEMMKDLQNNSISRGNEIYFEFKDVQKILNHPYIYSRNEKNVLSFLQKMTNELWIKIPYRKIAESFSSLTIEKIFHIADQNSVIDYLTDVFDIIQTEVVNESKKSLIESEQFYHFLKNMNRLKSILKDREELEKEMLWDLITEVIGNQKIPFTGEPLKGIQIMGTLETRLLDFENVFFLSMNEGIFPRKRYDSSFIPFNIRKAFRLPVYRDEQSSAAYIFYRLLQRSKNIFLFYNSAGSDFAGGEKSRFITQLELELCKQNQKITIKTKPVTIATGKSLTSEISIEKNPQIVEILKEIEYSPSAITMYLNCPLQFYLTKVAGLEEKDELTEWMDSSQFGNIFHNILEILYKDFVGEYVERDEIENIQNKIDDAIDIAFRKELKEQSSDLSGRNKLLRSVLKKLVTSMLNLDKQYSPFKIIELETILHSVIDVNGSEIKLKGKADRIDEKKGSVRIIDYKTGRTDYQKRRKETYKEFFDKVREKNLKQIFQAYFYSYLYKNENPDAEIRAGVCSAKASFSGYEMICENGISEDEIHYFEEMLRSVLKEILDPDVPILQTQSMENCKYCSFKSICIRG